MFPSERPSEWLWRLLPETCLRRCHTSMMEFFVKVVLLTSMYSWHCSGVSTVNFEQVNVGWVFWIIRHQSIKNFYHKKSWIQKPLSHGFATSLKCYEYLNSLLTPPPPSLPQTTTTTTTTPHPENCGKVLVFRCFQGIKRQLRPSWHLLKHYKVAWRKLWTCMFYLSWS